jgi:hypothetical protein
MNFEQPMVGKYLYIIIFLLFLSVFFLISCNPFAPGLDDSSDGVSTILGDQRITDGVFQNLKYAYTFRDTTIYGQLLDGNFEFVYTDYDRGIEIPWGREEEMRTTYGLFQNVQWLDLIWNEIISTYINSDSTETSISRRFNLKVTFNPNDKIDIDGNATFQMQRQRSRDPWMIVRWKDEAY